MLKSSVAGVQHHWQGWSTSGCRTSTVFLPSCIEQAGLVPVHPQLIPPVCEHACFIPKECISSSFQAVKQLKIILWGQSSVGRERLGALLPVQMAAAPRVGATPADVHENVPFARVTLPQRHLDWGIWGDLGLF